MPAKTKYVIVLLESIISGHPKIWVRERVAEKFSGIFFDPQVGRNVLFKEAKHVKGKTRLDPKTKEIFQVTDTPIPTAKPTATAVAKK